MEDLIILGIARKTRQGEKEFYEWTPQGDNGMKVAKQLKSIQLFPASILPDSTSGASPDDLIMIGKVQTRAKAKSSR